MSGMVRWMLFILLSSWFLYQVPPPSPYAARPLSPTKTITGPQQHPPLGERLARALVIGDQRALNGREARPYRRLGLVHLFTPSGLHLTAAAKPLAALKRLPTLGVLLMLFLMLAVYFIPHIHFAAKRMALWSILRQGQKPADLLNWPWPGASVTFVAAFMIDFAWGTWVDSPLSFCYSFLFAGCFLLLSDSPKLLWPLGLLLAYGILGEWRGESVSALALLASLLLTALFTPVFFFGAAALLLNWLSPFNINEIFAPLTLAHQIVVAVANWHRYFPLLRPDMSWSLMALAVMSLLHWHRSSRRLKLLFAFVLLIIPMRLTNIPPGQMRIQSMAVNLPHLQPAQIKRLVALGRSPQVQLITGERCQLIFTSMILRTHHCHYGGKRRRPSQKTKHSSKIRE